MSRTRSWRKKLAIGLTSLLVFSCLAYGVSVLQRSHKMYNTVKAGRGWRGNVHGSDGELGLRLVPNGRGAETFPLGPDVPSRIDSEGFRVPLDAADVRERKRPLVLALGCSFTFGAACVAEDAFAERVARKMDGTCLNAGICSGGAAQMLILARRLIPQYAPDVVLAQYSSWLMVRSAHAFAPTFGGVIPTPYFVRTVRGVELHPPAFDTITFDLPFAEYEKTPRGARDFANFVVRIGGPLLWHDDRHEFALFCARCFGHQQPFASPGDIEALVYPEIARLCRENRARLVLVWLDEEPFRASWDLPPVIAALDVPVALATKRMTDEIPEKTQKALHRVYTHVRGDPPVWIDGHPNPHAHQLIADEILRVMRGGG